TALNLQFDYLLLPNIYLNYSGSFPIWGKNDPSKIHDLMINTIGARYEKPNFSVGLPVSFQRNGQVNVGAYARIRNVFFGANNINMILGQRRMYNVNVYAGITFGRLHKKPSDIDNDLVSDKLDLCPTDSGTWKMKGCPDADGDRIPDYKDFCPYVKGPRKYNGCPDTDRDGIMDYEDACPTQKGFRINNGCPDTDKDGIIDTVDRCPTIPGVYENNGCPLEQLTCCQDSDGDGLNDNIDSCVNEPGPADNFGCPTSRRKVSRERVRYPRVEKVDIETLLDNNKKDIEKMTVAEVLDDMVTMDYVNVYFDSDKSNVRTQYKTKLGTFATKVKMNANTLILILGHTDSDGSLDYNMKLSNKRSEQTKKYLISKGIDANRIVIKNYGEEKPAESNDSEEDKSKNRRVEVRMMKLNN
ncbi:OmpA family protein, partial [bacterium]|nr:OmpA family protein [bacterium]